MKREHLEYLSDPLSGKRFDLKTFEEKDGVIMAGILESDENIYPIINGIPRILGGELRSGMLKNHIDFLRQYKELIPAKLVAEWEGVINGIVDLDKFVLHQKKTGESFAYEWKTIYRENDYEKNNFFHFLSPFIKQEDIEGKAVLDIGCGSGRFAKQAVLAGAKIVFATDVGESVEVAYGMVKEFSNACVVQADIYAMPFHQTIDLAFCIGVLHHLPKPKDGFLALPKVVKRGGKMLIWVYSRRNNARALYFYEPLRSVMKRLPKPLVYKLSYIPAIAVHGINQITHILREWGAEKLSKKVPFFYYANFSFNMKLNDSFDVLATPKSNYYYYEEIQDWFKDARLADIQSYEHPEAGITCIGKNEW
jgi:SAM-dependent methyltransferase/uncharacterized protein YbaR (Trm112 family)